LSSKVIRKRGFDMTNGECDIRPATEDDLDTLDELWWKSAHYHEELEPRFQYASDATQATREFMSKQIQSKTARFWVAQDDDDIIGYIEAMVVERPPIHAQRKIGYIGSLYVKTDARRKGIGVRLWETAHTWLIENGATIINLMVATENPVALEFWKKLNFREIMVRLELHQS
jgi:ribosomal protein S18 acetylase RimI-like enzyme